jgi:Ca2+-binding EF-hand superfamily protein
MKFAYAMLIAAVSAVRLTQKNSTKDGPPSVADIFAAIDTDTNGELSLEEVLAWAAANAADNNLPTEPAFWEAQFAAADADGDNAVTPAELQAHLSNVGGEKPSAATVFAAIDADADGSITRDELTVWVSATAAESGMPTDAAFWDAEFAAADADADGSVTLPELQALFDSY